MSNGQLGNAGQLAYLASMAGSANPAFAGAQAVLGIIQSGVALSRLSKLRNERMAQFSDNIKPLQDNVNMWENRVRTGVPQSYENLAVNTATAQQAARYRNIADMSAGLGGYMARVSSVDTANLGLRLAQMNDQERRAAMSQLDAARRGLTSQQNMQTQADRQYRMMREQALGGALRAGTANLATALDYGMPRLGGFNAPETTFVAPEQISPIVPSAEDLIQNRFAPWDNQQM